MKGVVKNSKQPLNNLKNCYLRKRRNRKSVCCENDSDSNGKTNDRWFFFLVFLFFKNKICQNLCNFFLFSFCHTLVIVTICRWRCYILFKPFFFKKNSLEKLICLFKKMNNWDYNLVDRIENDVISI